MLKIRRSHDCLIFIMGIPITWKDHLCIEMWPRPQCVREKAQTIWPFCSAFITFNHLDKGSTFAVVFISHHWIIHTYCVLCLSGIQQGPIFPPIPGIQTAWELPCPVVNVVYRMGSYVAQKDRWGYLLLSVTSLKWRGSHCDCFTVTKKKWRGSHCDYFTVTKFLYQCCSMVFHESMHHALADSIPFICIQDTFVSSLS